MLNKMKVFAAIAAVCIVFAGAGIVAGINFTNRQQASEAEKTPYESQERMEENTAKIAEADTDDVNDTNIDADEQYRTLLIGLQDDGIFLQYAHMEDLNGDGTEELILLHDNTDLTIYQIQQDKPKAVYAASAEYGFMCCEEPVQDETYEESSRESEQPLVRIELNQSEHKIVLNPLEEDYQQSEKKVRIDCDTWTDSSFDTETSDGYRNISAANETDAQMLFSDQLSYLLGKADVNTAYERFLRQEEMFLTAEACYEYIYLDDNDVPELVISEDSTFSSQVILYCYQEGLIKQVQNELGSNGTIYYKERENQLLSTINKDSGEAVLYSLQDGKLTAEHTSYFSMDDSGEMVYEIDGKSVSTDEGQKFWDTTGYLTAGQNSENAVHFKDAV